jgi:hypothetical protein
VTVLGLAVLGFPTPVWADDPPVIDLDQWHEQFSFEEETPKNLEHPRILLGLYPGVSGVIGPPNWASYQASIYVSVYHRSGFGLFAGYGEEWGPVADSRIYTLGWGGLRTIDVASRQKGFYGKFLRYRRWQDPDHGLHHGLSVGSETGVGYLSLAFEFGAARSERNHWLLVAQVSLKVALPIGIPFGK